MTDEGPRPTEPLSALSGIDLVRRTLEEARAAARAQGKDAGRGRSVAPTPRRVAGQRRSWSGPGPDARDPNRWAAWRATWPKSGVGRLKSPRAPCWATG